MHRHRTPTVHSSKKVLDSVRSEINVTPLVDVCLVLLIIFMVVTDKLTRGKDVQLPKTKYHKTIPDNDDPVVSVTKVGSRVQVYWDRDALQDMDALKKRLNEELHRKARPMFVKADADKMTYGDIYPVLMAIHDAGAPGVQLSTQELKEKR
jgi:biopolymer transport protein ExbD